LQSIRDGCTEKNWNPKKKKKKRILSGKVLKNSRTWKITELIINNC
jgi:hypothetical protein